MTNGTGEGGPIVRPFGTLLVANRGEIACRVMRTARRLGLRTVAVHSDPDARARHVAEADEAIALGGTSAAASYLDIDAVIDAARRAGADALHPGYGFLSENPEFAEACARAGIVFVGPPPAAMRAMALKDAAKRLMTEAGVPVVPGYHGEAQDEARLAAEAEAAGYPVLIKARAGGGGKGMRRVESAEGFAAALAAARREAAASFGDDAVLVERYVASPRHVEVQVFGDAHGNVVHLFERDCSLQRRHQKVLEESPAPGISAAVREAMTVAAVRAARAIGYVGAGTVEFIADGREGLRADGFWFMEMNTRLQVEHPVTEAVTGVDLVEWQLRVAAGEPLPLAQDAIPLRGHAIEARLYAEDPGAGFLPATGTLRRLAFGDGVRVDTGVVEGDAVTPHYDPMLAKLVAHAARREAALATLARALDETLVLGTVTNRAFLARLCRHPDVVAGRVDTGLIEREREALTAAPDARERRAARAVVAVLEAAGAGSGGSGTAAARAAARETGGSGVGRSEAVASGAARTLAERLGDWRLWGAAVRRVVLAEDAGEEGDGVLRVTCTGDGRGGGPGAERAGEGRWSVTDGAETLAVELDPAAVRRGGASARVDGRRRRVDLVEDAEGVEIRLGGHVHRFARARPGEAREGGEAAAAVLAPMPGRVIAVGCAVGDAVRAGQTLVTLEAMKMEHALTAAADGTVERVAVGVGDQVEQGEELLRLERNGSS